LAITAGAFLGSRKWACKIIRRGAFGSEVGKICATPGQRAGDVIMPNGMTNYVLDAANATGVPSPK
jgi:hypothetical protein